MVDYFIIGAGLAGIAFAETALNNGKTVLVFDNDQQGSSRTAAGIYNPVILKRFSGLANAQEHLNEMNEFHSRLKLEKGIDAIVRMPVLRKFASFEEQNNWFIAADKKDLAPFLSIELIKSEYSGVDSKFHFGQVLQTGYVDTEILLEQYHSYLKEMNLFSNESFHTVYLELFDGYVEYKGIKAKHVVFAEGYGIQNNAFFNYLPLDGTKGEILIIKAPDLKLDVILNAGVFILPIGNDMFKVGATYNWNDKTKLPTAEGRAELTEKLEEVLNCDYEIIAQEAGIRPTVKDRKPLLGTHSVYNTLHVLNGLGTRGVMLGPAMAKILYDHIENGTALDKDISIERFKKLFFLQWDQNS